MEKINCKKIASLLLGCCLFWSAVPVLTEIFLILPFPPPDGKGIVDIMYRITPLGWLNVIFGYSPFWKVFTWNSVFTIGLVFTCVSIFLWVRKPWRWWTAANLIVSGTMTSWLYMYFFGLLEWGLLGTLIVYLFCFLTAKIWQLFRRRKTTVYPTTPA